MIMYIITTKIWKEVSMVNGSIKEIYEQIWAEYRPKMIRYQYRVTCVHYAKKNFLSVQKIDNVSNVIQF